MKSGVRKSKWNERFHLPNKEFGYTQDIFSKVAQHKIAHNKGMFRQTRPSTKSSKARLMTGNVETIQNKFGKTMSNQNLFKELKWNNRFNVAASKNNLNVHRDYKEFFDKPIDYDVSSS